LLSERDILDYILTLSSIGFFEYKSTGELVRANECYYRLSGYPRDCSAHTKHKFLELIHPADVDLVSDAWKSMNNGHWKKFELRYRNGTEQGQWALVACQPVKNADGMVTSIIGAVTDISTQKRSEKIALDRAEALEQARVSEERFKRCMDSAPFGCMTADVTKGVQYVNEAWWELSQHARVPLDQIDWNSVLHEDDLDVAEQGWQVSQELCMFCCDLLI
jgi:PAS domain S-box-containing protein